MLFQKLEYLFTFFTFVVLTFSSPIKNKKGKVNKESITSIKPTEIIQSITDGLSIVEVRENNNLWDLSSFCDFIVDNTCINKILNATGISSPQYTVKVDGMKGSTFSVPKKDGNGYYVGRNIDLNENNQNLILVNYPINRYSSISTINPDFIKQIGNENGQLSNDVLRIAPLFATLDGLNEKGVSISVNMNQGDIIKTEINNSKYNFNASFLMRIVLDNASSTDKAIDILRNIEFHNDFDFNIHFMISDATGKSVVVEYAMDKKEKYNKMIVTKSSIVTNFNIAKGKKPSLKEKKQYSIIKKMIKTTRNMDVNAVKKTLEAAKHNTQYSVIYDLNNRKAIYYVNENYQKEYKVQFDKNYDDSFPAKPEDEQKLNIVDVDVTKNIKKVEKAEFRVFEYEGDYGFNEFMEQGGARSEIELYGYILARAGFNIPFNNVDYEFPIPVQADACSAFTVQNENGDGYFFGRNYDWLNGTALAVVTHPKNGYASISTIDTNIINMFAGGRSIENLLITAFTNSTLEYELPDEILKEVAVYIPFDGINEKGLTISMNMIPDGTEISMVDQNDKGKANLTMTTLIRYLLDTAATVDEAVEKIKSINMHNYYVHFLISDASGKSVLVEFKNDSKEGVKVFVIDTPLVTNYYLADDEEMKEKNFEVIHHDLRYEIILDRLTKKPKQNLKDVRNTLRAGNQDGTAWSIAFDKVNLEATYFIKNNFSVGYRIKLLDEETFEEETTVVFDDDEYDFPTDDVDDFSTANNDDEKTVVDEKN